MNLQIRCSCGKKHLLQIDKRDLIWTITNKLESEIEICKSSITFNCFNCHNNIRIDFYIYNKYPGGEIINSDIDYENCTPLDINKNIVELKIEALFKNHCTRDESLGDHLRNLLTPYKCLLDVIDLNDPNGILKYIETNNFDFKENLNKLIRFSKLDIMEDINYE